MGRGEGIPALKIDPASSTKPMDSSEALSPQLSVNEDGTRTLTLMSEKELNQPVKLAKVLIPHISLVCLLLGYIGVGAAIFRAIEVNEEYRQIDDKLHNIRKIYDRIVTESRFECEDNFHAYGRWMTRRLNELADAHLNCYAPVNPVDIISESETAEHSVPRWSYAASILFALGMITTTGYSYVQINTNAAKIIAIMYGLVGFPLLFITAADIGKFLSEVVSAFYTRWNMRHPRRLSHHTYGESSECQMLNSSRSRDSFDSMAATTSFELPPTFVFGAATCVAILGALMYTALEGWSFVDSVYYTFNAITNVTLVDIPVSGMLFACVTVVYVIFGLAVVTMSLDLAENHFREIFRKIHYFGRHIKIRSFAGRFRIDEDVRAIMNVIAAIRLRNPNKETITQEDIANFMKEEIQRMTRGSPLLDPEDEAIQKQKHRHSVAFCPEYLPALQFADDADAPAPPPVPVTCEADPNTEQEDDVGSMVELSSESSLERTPELDVIIFDTENHRYQVQGGHVTMLE